MTRGGTWSRFNSRVRSSVLPAGGDECAAGLWSAPGGDLILTLNRHPSTRSAASEYGQLVGVARDDLGYVGVPLPGDADLPENTWLGVRSSDGPVSFNFYSQQAQYVVVILLATKYAALSDDQLQGFELILSDVAAAQLAKIRID